MLVAVYTRCDVTMWTWRDKGCDIVEQGIIGTGWVCYINEAWRSVFKYYCIYSKKFHCIYSLKFFSNDDVGVFLIGHGHVTEIFHYFSQNEGVILKMDSWLNHWTSHRRRRQGAGGLQPLQRWKNLQKLATIGQEIGFKSGEILVNNRFFIGQPP